MKYEIVMTKRKDEQGDDYYTIFAIIENHYNLKSSGLIYDKKKAFKELEWLSKLLEGGKK